MLVETPDMCTAFWQQAGYIIEPRPGVSALRLSPTEPIGPIRRESHRQKKGQAVKNSTTKGSSASKTYEA